MLRCKAFYLGLAIACLLFTGTPAAAQTAPPAPKVVEEPTGEPRTNIAIGYSYMKDSSWPEEHLFMGWLATITTRLTKNLAVVGEVGGSHGEYGTTGFTIQRYAAMGGLKLAGGEDTIRPFFQFVAGVTRQGGDVGRADGIAVQPGGGADFMIGTRFTLRGQGDFRWVLEDDEIYSSYRFTASLVIHLGKRR